MLYAESDDVTCVRFDGSQAGFVESVWKGEGSGEVEITCEACRSAPDKDNSGRGHEAKAPTTLGVPGPPDATLCRTQSSSRDQQTIDVLSHTRADGNRS